MSETQQPAAPVAATSAVPKPGAWRVGNYPSTVVSDTRPDGYAYGAKAHSDDGGYLIAESCTEDNARRIAALPDLIAVLQEAHDRPLATEGVDWWIEVRKALAKATGAAA